MMAISPSDIFGLNRARAAAKSIKFNPRNLEFLWYPFWTRAISRIACEIDSERCTVAPQYPLWRIWTHDDTQLGSIIMLPEGDAMDDLAAELVCDQNIDDDLFDDQESISTLNETLSVKTRSRITDFAMLYWVESDSINSDKDDDEDEAFLIEHEFIPALIEVKRSASRKLSGEALLHDQANLMHRAKEAVFRQALYLFANPRWCHQETVLVIAAVGDLWTYTCVSRNDHQARNASADEMNVEWEPDVSEFEALPWSSVTTWGSKGEHRSRVEEVVKWIELNFIN